MAKYDEPAVIDYVLKKTGQNNLSYIAHSQGTTLMFTALAENFGNLNDKINLFVAMAPVTYLQDSTDALMRYASDFFPYLQSSFKDMGV
jgi:pimeloyl-ACP methyl ester carboxylesterase